jgi:hypothetical protein
MKIKVQTKSGEFEYDCEQDEILLYAGLRQEDSTLYVIPREKLLELFEQDHAAGYQVMRRLATTIAGDFVSVLSV